MHIYLTEQQLFPQPRKGLLRAHCVRRSVAPCKPCTCQPLVFYTLPLARRAAIARLQLPRLSAKIRPTLYDVDVKPTIDVALAKEYEAISRYWEEHRKADTTPERRQMLVWLLIRALSQHIAKKEQVFYPAVRQKLGDTPADRALGECKAIKKQLADLDAASPSGQGYSIMLEAVMKDVSKHLQSDKQLIGSLAAAEPALMDKYGIDFWWADYTAPTRPHPELPSRPPFDEALLKATKTADQRKDNARFYTATY